MLGRYDRAEEISFVDQRFAYWYVRTKVDMDPVLTTILELAGAEGSYGDILDLGCGRGQLALLLGEAGLARSVHGVDWDEPKIRVARAAASGASYGATFEAGDLRTVELPEVDTVLLVDVLHYLAPTEQDALLLRAARAARTRVLVRDVDPDRGSSSTLTKSWEWVTTTLGYNRGERVAPRSFADISSALTAEGFTVEQELCGARGLSNVLLVARR